MDARYRLRLAREDDLEHLPAIEAAASTLFDDLWGSGAAKPDTPYALEPLRGALRAGRLWVAADAEDRPVGFAFATVVDQQAHLQEVDVHPQHGRRGLGRALVGTVLAWAKVSGFDRVTLTTEREIPWNAPFYERMAFEVLPESDLGPELRALYDREVERAHAYNRRVAMVRRSGP